MIPLDDRTRTRLMDLAAYARDALPAEELARRLEWTVRNGNDELRWAIEPDGDVVAYWAGDRLVTLDPDTYMRLVADEQVHIDLGALPDAPDDLSGVDGL